MPREFANQTLYTVQAGDSLGGIAAAHGKAVDDLVRANQGLLSNPDLIQIGWQLVIPGDTLATNPVNPPPTGEAFTVYTVQPGDMLSVLASRWNCTLQAIVELNGIANADDISVGQTLRQPGSVAAAAPNVAAAAGAANPAGTLFSRYPLDSVSITGGFREDYGGYLHRGIDFGRVDVGTPIRAPAAGSAHVHQPGDGWGDGSFGICVVLSHPGTGWFSIYAHMSAARVASGANVQPGDVLGLIGYTGKVSPPGPAGAHLHWQLSTSSGFPPDFEYIANPLDFMPR